MPQLQYVTVLTRDVASLLTGVTDLDVVTTGSGGALLYATSRSGGAISVFSVAPDGSVSFLDHQSLGADADHLELMQIAGVDCAVAMGPQSAMPQLYQIDSAGRLIGGATTLGNASGGLDILVCAEFGGETYLYGADSGHGQGLQAYRVRPNGTLETLDPPSLSGGVSRIMMGEVGAKQFLLAVSAAGDQITSLEVRTDGSLQTRGTAGADAGLGVAGISALSQVTLPDGDYVIVAAQGSSSLSVLQLTANGTLIAVDHVLDDLNTRFQNVTALETVTVGDRSFVLVGGADDGVSLFELLPGGQLLHLSTFLDDFDISLENVSSLAAVVVDGDLQIFIGSGTETGVTQLTYDLGTHGATQIGGAQNDTLTGSAVGDVLSGGAGNDQIEGRQGRDILMDGAGRDTLTGGAGADIFVLAADGDLDMIMDFDPNNDRIDLSAWPMLRNTGQLTITPTGYGAEIRFGVEVLQIYSADGLSLSANDLLGGGLIGLSRVPVSTAEVTANFYGTHGSDVLQGNWAENTLVGRSGDDHLSGGDGNDRILGGTGHDQLMGDDGADEMHGQSENDLLIGGDGNDSLYGSWHDDTLYGGNGDDSLHGGSRDDMLYGQAGNDTLEAMTGNDWLEGGSGNDVLRGGPGRDTLYGGSGNDLVAGGNHSDTLMGEVGNDTLRGQDGLDVLEGGAGNDLLTGGEHADDFVFAPGFGRDTITDFTDNRDELYLDDALWGGGMGIGQMINTFARVEGNTTVLDFGDGNQIILNGITDPTLLYNDVVIF